MKKDNPVMLKAISIDPMGQRVVFVDDSNMALGGVWYRKRMKDDPYSKRSIDGLVTFVRPGGLAEVTCGEEVRVFVVGCGGEIRDARYLNLSDDVNAYFEHNPLIAAQCEIGSLNINAAKKYLEMARNSFARHSALINDFIVRLDAICKNPPSNAKALSAARDSLISSFESSFGSIIYDLADE